MQNRVFYLHVFLKPRYSAAKYTHAEQPHGSPPKHNTTEQLQDRRVIPTSSSPHLLFSSLPGYPQPGAGAHAYAQAPVFRTVPQARTRRLRVSWFSLGLMAGMGVMYGMMHIVSTTQAALPHMLQEAKLEKPAGVELASLQAQRISPPTPQAKPTPPPVQISYPLNLEFPITRGDTLLDVMTQNHVPHEHAVGIVSAVRKVYNPRDLTVGRTIAMELDKLPHEDEPFVKAMHIEATNLDTIVVERHAPQKYVAKKISTPVHKATAHAGGRINSSLYASALKNGLPDALLAQVVKAFSYDVDFQRDIHPGDRFDALYERYQTEDGRFVKSGKLLYAALSLSGKHMEIYAYTDSTGSTEFYTARGESTKKALLRTPINGANISSGFGMRRHPILGFNKMHKGLDFAAATGTPIYAAGDGTVQMAGPNGAYGNYVKIQHNATYATAYGHMHRVGKGIKPGMKVKQGQVIGYVGTTGRSTGPHLHYEVLVMGNQVNPAKMTLKTGNQLGGRELARFNNFRDSIKQELASRKAPKAPAKEMAMSE
jgi:murein DD-endopeptidase MepM/ murein hydrolase activator NlpD